ncbi:unnamed protein product [Larinioides sclopetarius]|uniref:Uncharacterized protein n=1 Tax=Larinioides sclopetarius TaxID=280406 RepID=A0AAV1ZIU5_9ARAC
MTPSQLKTASRLLAQILDSTLLRVLMMCFDNASSIKTDAEFW